MVQQKKVKAEPVIKIGDKWISMNTWARVHPGGAAPLQRYYGQDATDAFAALHSEEAWQTVRKMKGVSVSAETEKNCIPATKLTKAFRSWRAELEREGFFQRQWHLDAVQLTLMVFWYVLGYALSTDYPLLAVLVLGLGSQQAGWVGHDYGHGRGKACYYLNQFVGGCFNGFSSEWWSQKHNTHHVHPNQVGVDSDIHNDPILHLHVPSGDKDVWYRQYQHYYYHFVYSFLTASWRLQSAQFAWKNNMKFEMACIAFNYVASLWLLPLPVFLGSIMVSGFLIAEVVTATHQSEEILPGMDHEFIRNQFVTTRDVHMKSVVGNYVWGGMQYQLIHHLFPTMPRYYYPAMVPKVTAFAKKNGIEYRTAGAVEIFKMNYNTMKTYAQKVKAQ